MPTLFVLQGPDKGRTYSTEGDSAVIGRTAEQVTLSDHTASRRHAEIQRFNGSWILTDLRSSNGTYLNGQRVVDPVRLKHGDQIKIGSTLLVFSGPDAEAASATSHLFHDLVELDPGTSLGGSSILAAVDSSAESVILQTPEAADAVAAWNVIYKIAEIIGTSDSILVFLEKVADIVFTHLIVDHLVILVGDDQGENMTPRIIRFRGMERGRRPKIVTSQTIINHVLNTRDGVLCANAMTDDRFSGDMQDSIHRLGLRSVLCVPIVARNRVHGILHLDSSMSHHTYTQEQLRLAVAIGRLTGMAIENASLLESRVRTERLAATGETVAYLSHHIRNILQGVQGGAEVIELALRNHNFQTVENGWNLVRRNLDRILHLTLNMLTFSKERRPHVEMTQLNGIVADVISLSQVRAKERSVELVSELEEIPAAPLDPDGVHQVLHNIVLNAIDVVPAGTGRVTVRTGYDPNKGEVTASIEDNGPGIPEEQRRLIFDAFHSSKGHGGTGLGLAAAKKIVDECGGTIEVVEAPGGGSVFHVRLPTDRTELADSDQTHGPAAG